MQLIWEFPYDLMQNLQEIDQSTRFEDQYQIGNTINECGKLS